MEKLKVDSDLIFYDLDKVNQSKGNINTKKSNSDLDKNAFLHLLTTQLSNQDPLSPMDDKEFIAQLAQFSSLEELNNLTDTVKFMSKDLAEAIDYLNINQIDANMSILHILKAIAEKLGVDLEDVEDEIIKDLEDGQVEENPSKEVKKQEEKVISREVSNIDNKEELKKFQALNNQNKFRNMDR